MAMRCAHLLPLLLLHTAGLCQSGPGGVGSTANNVLWLNGGSNLALAGSAVVSWGDQSGSGNTATSPSVAARPMISATSLNGYPVLTFDGTNDELRVPDVGTLDLQQWDIFTINSVNTAKNNNAWLSKGTSTQPNYALWSPMNGALQLPIYDIFTLYSAPTTPAGTVAGSPSILEYENTVLLGLFPSRTVYRSGNSIYNDVNLLQLPKTNSNPLYIGNVQGSTGWFLNGNIAEVIMYNGPINSAQKIIVNNYLSAKYDLPLLSTDIYTQDNPAAGNYDHEVAGIGRLSSTSFQTDSKGSAVVRINNPTGLGNNEFMLWGHDNGLLGAWGSTDLPTGVQGRWHRTWRVSEVSPTGTAVDVGNVDMIFDLAGQGPVVPGDLRLLVDANNNGVFADDPPIAGATFFTGTQYRFSGISALVNGRRFTLGTINTTTTPLPIELVHFDARPRSDRTVDVEWTTASEHGTDHFVVQRSPNTTHWQDVVRVSAAGNSLAPTSYATNDTRPLPGLSYYRLQEADVDGKLFYCDAVAVRLEEAVKDLLVYPDPAQDQVALIFGSPAREREVRLINELGQVFSPPTMLFTDYGVLDVSALAPGTYIVMVISDREILNERLVIAR